jgi:hypothetical protein
MLNLQWPGKYGRRRRNRRIKERHSGRTLAQKEMQNRKAG